MQSFSRGCFGFFTTWQLPPARAREPEASEEACLCAPISVLISNSTHPVSGAPYSFGTGGCSLRERESEWAFRRGGYQNCGVVRHSHAHNNPGAVMGEDRDHRGSLAASLPPGSRRDPVSRA